MSLLLEQLAWLAEQRSDGVARRGVAEGRPVGYRTPFQAPRIGRGPLPDRDKIFVVFTLYVVVL